VVAAVTEAGKPMLALVKEILRRADTEAMPVPDVARYFSGGAVTGGGGKGISAAITAAAGAAAGAATEAGLNATSAASHAAESASGWASGREALYFFTFGAAFAVAGMVLIERMRK